jgi:hypothetical protein
VIDRDNPADTLDQADEEILTYTVSDEAIEAAAKPSPFASLYTYNQSAGCGCTLVPISPITTARLQTWRGVMQPSPQASCLPCLYAIGQPGDPDQARSVLRRCG